MGYIASELTKGWMMSTDPLDTDLHPSQVPQGFPFLSLFLQFAAVATILASVVFPAPYCPARIIT